MGPTLATATSGLGSGLEQAGIEAQQRERRAILNRQFDRTQANQKQATAQTLDEAQTMGGTQRLADMQAAADAATAQTKADLTGAGADILNTAGSAGGVQSQALQDATAERQATEGDRMSQIAQQLGAVRSVGKVQTAGAQRRAALAEALGSMWASDRAYAQAAQLDAEDVSVPWYGQLGSVINAAGKAAINAGGFRIGTDAPATADYSLNTKAKLGDAGTAGNTVFGKVKFGNGTGTWSGR